MVNFLVLINDAQVSPMVEKSFGQDVEEASYGYIRNATTLIMFFKIVKYLVFIIQTLTVTKA